MVGNSSKGRGQGLVEFILILPLLLLIAVGVLDLGRTFFALITISNASREGARYLSFTPADAAYSGDPFHGTKNAAIQESVGSIITLAPADVNAICSVYNGLGECASGSTATVTVSYRLELIAGWVLPSPITLNRATRMVIP